MTEATSFTVRVPLTIRRRSGRKMVVTPTQEGAPARTTRADPALVKALARAFRYQKLLPQAERVPSAAPSAVCSPCRITSKRKAGLQGENIHAWAVLKIQVPSKGVCAPWALVAQTDRSARTKDVAVSNCELDARADPQARPD